MAKVTKTGPDSDDLVAGLKTLIGPALVPPDLARPDVISRVRSLLTLNVVGGDPLPSQQELSVRIQAVRTLLKEFATELHDWPTTRLPADFHYASCIASSDAPHETEMQLLGEALTTVFQLNVLKPKKLQIQDLQTSANALYKKPAYPKVRWFAQQRLERYLLPWIAEWLIERESQVNVLAPNGESPVRVEPAEDTVSLAKDFLRAAEHHLLAMTLYFSPQHKSVDAHETLYVYARLLESLAELESRSTHEVEPFNGMSTEDAENLVTFSCLAADYYADEDNEVGPFNSRDQRVLVHHLTERVQFDLFVEDTPRGHRLMEKWNEWLGSCPCPRDRVVEPSSVKCRVHTQMDFCLLCLDLCNYKATVVERDWRTEIRERVKFDTILRRS